MRIWVNPDKMAKLGLTATDISNAIQAQNRQNPAGAIGQSPAPTGHRFSVPRQRPRAAARIPQQFDDIVLRARAGRVAAADPRCRHTWNSERRITRPFSRFNGQPSGNHHRLSCAWRQCGGNGEPRVASSWRRRKQSFPAGIEYAIPYDATIFVRAAIADVMHHALHRRGLVILVVFVFLAELARDARFRCDRARRRWSARSRCFRCWASRST